jgi:hypothetical protein
MELTKRIEGTRQLGNEFLTWLLFKSLSQDGIIETEIGRVEVWFEDKITLVAPFAGSEVNILKGEAPAQGQEAVTALRQGKQVDDAKLSVTFQSKRWHFLFSGPKFTASAVKVPAVATETELEAVIDRFDLVGTLEEVMRSLYHEYLKIRLDDTTWGTECTRVEKWLSQ